VFALALPLVIASLGTACRRDLPAIVAGQPTADAATGLSFLPPQSSWAV
jgi:hypothetical protein